MQALRVEVGLDERIETGLVDGDFAPLETFDLLGVDVDAKHVIAGIGKACTGDEANVAGPEYGDSHVFPEDRPDGRKGRNSNEIALPGCRDSR